MATPVIVCGVSKMMGGRVAPRLQPEAEVIQFITSAERAKVEIPTMLAGQAPPPDPDNVGTHNFERIPKAVIFGRGFEPSVVQEIRSACGGSESKLAWIFATEESIARNKENPPDVNDPKSLDAYADSTAAAVRSVLSKIRTEGKEGVDGMYNF